MLMDLSVQIGQGIPDVPGMPAVDPLYKGIGAMVVGAILGGFVLRQGIGSLYWGLS